MAFTEQEAAEAFHVVDTDHDGMITPQELTRLWERTGEAMADEQLAEVFGKADTDQDGLISLPEFIALLT